MLPPFQLPKIDSVGISNPDVMLLINQLDSHIGKLNEYFERINDDIDSLRSDLTDTKNNTDHRFQALLR